MEPDYKIFLRTAETLITVKSVLEKIFNCQLEKHDDESFYTTLLGVTVFLEEVDINDNETVFEFKNEVVPLCTYDLQINFSYNPLYFMRDRERDWQKSMAVVLADMVCLELNCEGAVVEDYEIVIDRFMFMEKYYTTLNRGD